MLHAITGVALVFAAIPGMVAWSCSEAEPGKAESEDFWWLLTNAVFQLLALTTLATPMLAVGAARTPGRRWAWAYVSAGAAVTVAAVPLYLWASVRYSSTAMFVSNAVVALLQVQLSLTALSLGTKGKRD